MGNGLKVRSGGVIWHTQGSGKSYTMVMLAQLLAMEKSIPNPKIILVTDRVELDDQIYQTFDKYDKEVAQNKTGTPLMKKQKNTAQNLEELLTVIPLLFWTVLLYRFYLKGVHPFLMSMKDP